MRFAAGQLLWPLRRMAMALTLLCAHNGWTAPTPAIKSDNFVERIGVVTHFGYTDLPYGTKYEQCKQRLTELGIRYIRDGADPEPWKHHEGIYDTCGIRMLMVSSHVGSQLWDTTLASTWLTTKLGTYKPASVLAIEGTNEYNGSNRTTWASELVDFTRRLWTSARANPLWESTPVIGPTLSSGVYGTVGNISQYVDVGGLHWYPGALEASHRDFNYFAWHLNQAQTAMYPGRRIWLTETGYHNAVQSTWYVSESVAAKYQPRALLWFLYYNGIERTFIYELLDEGVSAPADPEKNWGLLRYDLSPKPVFTALKNLFTLLKDTDTVFTPASLDYSIQGDTAKVMQVLFQKRSGAWYLAIWQEARSWNDTTKSDNVIPRRALTLTLATSANSIRVFEPCNPASLSVTPTATFADASSVSMSVPDHVMLVEIDRATATRTNSPGAVTRDRAFARRALQTIIADGSMLGLPTRAASSTDGSLHATLYAPDGRIVGVAQVRGQGIQSHARHSGVCIVSTVKCDAKTKANRSH